MAQETGGAVGISVREVVKRFGAAVALNRIHLDIAPGELFFMLGPSGCGKTTLLRSIAGFYIPDEGQILFGEDDVTRVPPYKRNTGMMFQSYALWPHLSVEQNVAFGLEQRKVPKAEIIQRVGEALESVRMGQYAKRKPNQLSGGQQQRVALARSLVIRPRCLLLDEPLSNLDAKLRMEMRSEIRRVCKEFKLTTIYVTHDQKEALSVADRMVVMREGVILQAGSPLEVYRRPRSRFVADFIGEANFLEATVVRTGAGMAHVKTTTGQDLTGSLSDPSQTLPEGSKVTVCIRPEALKLETMAADENSFKGHIGEATYYGEGAQYEFLAEGAKLRIFELNPRFLGGARSDTLHAWAAPEDVIILAA